MLNPLCLFSLQFRFLTMYQLTSMFLISSSSIKESAWGPHKILNSVEPFIICWPAQLDNMIFHCYGEKKLSCNYNAIWIILGLFLSARFFFLLFQAQPGDLSSTTHFIISRDGSSVFQYRCQQQLKIGHSEPDCRSRLHTHPIYRRCWT